jgi:hypothetical protein
MYGYHTINGLLYKGEKRKKGKENVFEANIKFFLIKGFSYFGE